MKKLRVLWGVVLVFIISFTVSAQVYPRGAEKFSSFQLERQVAKAQQEAALVHLIDKEGKETHFSYLTYFMRGNNMSTEEKCSASKNGQVLAKVYHTTENIYFLLNRSDWENMYNECGPNTFVRTFNTWVRGKKLHKQVFVTDEYNYIDYSPSNPKLKTQIAFYNLDGKQYSLITYIRH